MFLGPHNTKDNLYPQGNDFWYTIVPIAFVEKYLDQFFNSVKTQTPYEIIVLHVINILTKRGMPNYDFRPLISSKLKREYPMGRQHVTRNVDR